MDLPLSEDIEGDFEWWDGGNLTAEQSILGR